MASIIWDRDPQEAVKNPYEYNAQMQFHREAMMLSNKLSDALVNKKKFSLSERTLEKAVWMLQTDALHAFMGAIILLEQKRHRVAGRLLRDIAETIDLIEYFNSQTRGAIKDLNDWFNDELVMHSAFREFIKKRDGARVAIELRNRYRILSKFTHRSYKVLLYGYAKGSGDNIFYDEGWSLPQSIAMYYAFLGYFGQLMVVNLKMFGVLGKQEVDSIWDQSMELEQIPRGYLSRENKIFLGLNDDEV